MYRLSPFPARYPCSAFLTLPILDVQFSILYTPYERECKGYFNQWNSNPKHKYCAKHEKSLKSLESAQENFRLYVIYDMEQLKPLPTFDGMHQRICDMLPHIPCSADAHVYRIPRHMLHMLSHIIRKFHGQKDFDGSSIVQQNHKYPHIPDQDEYIRAA